MRFSSKLKISPKIIFFSVAQICFFILTLMGEDIAYFLFIFFSVILMINIIFFINNFLFNAKIKFLRDIRDKVNEGEFFSVKLFFSNRSFFPILNIAVSDFLECDIKEKYRRFFFNWVRPNSTVTLDYGCICELRGFYTLGPVVVRFYDLLGFFYIEKDCEMKDMVYVYPKTFSIKKMVELTRGNLPWFGLGTRVLNSDDSEFFGIREYQEGDSIKQIHWFSTAKNNELMVREYQPHSFYQIALLFVLTKEENFGVGKEKVCEYIIKIVASLSKYFIERNICVEILSHTGKINHFPSNKGLHYLDEILKFCAMIKMESRITLSELFNEYCRYISPNSTVFVLLTDKNIPSFIEGLHFINYNISVVALVIFQSTFSRYPPVKLEVDILKVKFMSQLSRAKIKVLFFSQGDNLEEIFLGI